MKESTEVVTSTLGEARSSIQAQDAPSFALHCKELIKALGQAGEHASRVLPGHGGLALTPAQRSFISGALTLTADVFGFCKEVDVQHQWALDSFSDLLGTMFKANMNLLRLLFDTLDKAPPSQEYSDRQVVVSLQGMCVQVLNFDTTLVLHAWRTLVKEVGRCRAALGEDEDANDVLGLSGLVQDLCTAAVVTYGKCLELASSDGGQQFQRHLKSCKHLLSLLLVLLRDVDDGSGDTLPYYRVLLKLFSAVPPSVAGCHIPSAPLQSISTALLSVSEPMLQLMVARRCFAQQLLSRDVLEEGQSYAWCVCLVKVMAMFDRVPGGLQESDYLRPASNQEGCAQRCPVLEAVFECVRLCHTELALSLPALPGSSCVALYQSLCTSVSALLAQLNPEHLSNVEATLFKFAVCGEPNCSVLAADVWSFLWRWGTADLCRHYAFLLADTVLSLPPGPSLPQLALTYLAARATLFMAAEHKSNFIQTFAPADSDHLRLWSALSLHHFSADQQKQAISQLVVLASKCLEQAMDRQTGSYEDMYHALGTLCRVYELPGGAYSSVHKHHAKLMSLVPRLWEWSLLIMGLDRSQVAQALVSTLMQFTALVLPSLPSQAAGRVLSCASHLAHTSNCVAVLMSATSLLSACHHVTVPPGEEMHCLAPVTALCRLLLASTHWLVRHKALEAFKEFAQNTPYDHMVEQCIPEQLNGAVVDYLSQVTCGIRSSPTTLDEKQVVQRVQMRYSSLEQKLAVGSSVDDHQVEDLTEDCAMGADGTMGADSTMGSLSFESGLQLMVEGWQAVQEADWEGRDLSALGDLQLSMAQQLKRHSCSQQI